jgi:hypothetical protein
MTVRSEMLGHLAGKQAFRGRQGGYVKFFAFNNPIRNMIEVDE